MVAMKTACVFLIVLIVSVNGAGQWTTADPNDPGTQKAEELARNKIVETTGTCDSGLTVTNREQQVVNGMNYSFTIGNNPTTCGNNGAPQTCIVQVYVAPRKDPVVNSVTCQ